MRALACASLLLVASAPAVLAQDRQPAAADEALQAIGIAPSPRRNEAESRQRVSFGNRHTRSEAASHTHGIGDARPWSRAELATMFSDCGRCQEHQDMRGQYQGEDGP